MGAGKPDRAPVALAPPPLPRPRLVALPAASAVVYGACAQGGWVGGWVTCWPAEALQSPNCGGGAGLGQRWRASWKQEACHRITRVGAAPPRIVQIVVPVFAVSMELWLDHNFEYRCAFAKSTQGWGAARWAPSRWFGGAGKDATCAAPAAKPAVPCRRCLASPSITLFPMRARQVPLLSAGHQVRMPLCPRTREQLAGK